MATQSLPVPAGLPSPTLTNPDMILPESTIRSFSPNPYVQRPPSPSSLLYSHSNQSQSTIKLASAPQGRRGPSPRVKTPISAQSSSSTLRKRAGMETTSRMTSDDALASSPTLRDSISTVNLDNWENYKQKRLSNSSGSIHSEDLESIKWPGFDGPGHFDDSGVVLEEEEEEEDSQEGPFPKVANGDDDLDNERWLDEQEDGEDDPYSSAALSRRAEIILANAKKRLNVMEGNLRGARHSLLVTPSSFNTMKMASELSQQLSAARERDRQLYGGLSAIPPRQRQYQSSPLSSSGGPGHSRVFSETSVPSPFSPAGLNRLNNQRASSAMGAASGPWSPVEGYSVGRHSIRESKSHEVMREHRGSGWGNEHPLRSFSRNSGSPPNHLESLPEDDTPNLRRSASTTSDLRVQMNELKGRISSLKQRAKEDNMKRRSMQNLRTPSAFTSAEIWYAGVEAYKTSPVSADGGIGFMTGPSPVREELYENGASESSTPKILPADGPVNKSQAPKQDNQSDYQESQYEDAEEPVHQEEKPVENEADDEIEENDFVSVGNDDLEPGGESVYEDAVYEMPVAERHEDRVDAFDYEHFFLHSAMGTYSSASRRSSASSADSVETTRPVTAILSPQELESTPKRISLHQRNPSVDSVSTMATFATAAEERDSDGSDDGSNPYLDDFSKQILPHTQRGVAQSNGVQHMSASNRPTSAINIAHARATPNCIDSTDRASSGSRGSSPGADLVGGLRASKIFSILVESNSNSERRLSLNEQEKQLIYGLAASFQQLCMNLKSTSGDQYERKEWRRRLDDARKVLDGEHEGQSL